MTIMTIMTIWVWMLLPYKCPTTSVQLLHFGVKCSNFAIVKQNNKNNSLDRENFFPREGKRILSFECWILNYRRRRFWIIQFWIVSWRWTRNLSGKSKLNDSKSKLKNLNTKLEHRTWTQNLNTKLEHKTWTKQFKTQNWTTQNRLCR